MKHKSIKTALIIIVLILALVSFTSCSKTVYIPVESIKTEYKEHIKRDSVHLYDSIFVKMKNDTIWLEKYKYMYKDRFINDSVFIKDTIRIPYPFETVKEVNKPSSWQHFLMWCGGILVLVICGYTIFRIIKSNILKS